MLVVNVHVSVKDENIDAFKEATIENAKNSINEPGVIRFDFCQQEDDPSKFLIIEVYKDSEAPLEHKKTDHYAKWRDTVESMMAEKRYSVKYRDIYPDMASW